MLVGPMLNTCYKVPYSDSWGLRVLVEWTERLQNPLILKPDSVVECHLTAQTLGCFALRMRPHCKFLLWGFSAVTQFCFHNPKICMWGQSWILNWSKLWAYLRDFLSMRSWHRGKLVILVCCIVTNLKSVIILIVFLNLDNVIMRLLHIR